MHRLIYITLISIFLALPVSAGTMAHVLRIGEHATVIVEVNGREATYHLAGIEITNAPAAQELLRWSVGTSWVMLEPAPNAGEGFVYVYRSPDALFINRELVERGYARATLPAVAPASYVPVTYLGELNPPAITSERARSSGKGTGRPSKASPARPSPSRKPARARAPGPK
jgi:hypothetical protein